MSIKRYDVRPDVIKAYARFLRWLRDWIYNNLYHPLDSKLYSYSMCPNGDPCEPCDHCGRCKYHEEPCYGKN